jgi:hypothetical protein
MHWRLLARERVDDVDEGAYDRSHEGRSAQAKDDNGQRHRAPRGVVVVSGSLERQRQDDNPGTELQGNRLEVGSVLGQGGHHHHAHHEWVHGLLSFLE